jgi:LCP family protein required for cell wall assembly
MSGTVPARRVALPVAVLAAWIAGSVLGATQPARRASAAPLLQIEAAHADYVPVITGSEPIFILLLGSDARPEEPLTRTRADSIHVVAVSPAKGRATILGIPRDAFVEIPGYGQDKINASLTLGGPPLVVDTVEALTGLTMDYWAITGFESFDAMIDQVDGLVVDVPFALDDGLARASFEPGLQRLDGRDALAFARDRHDLPSGDFGRSENQGLLMISALTQLRHEFNKDPSRLLVWVGAFMRNVKTSLPFDELMSLAFTGTAINPKTVVNVVAPGGNGMVGGIAVVNLDRTRLAAMTADLAADGLLKKGNIPPSPNASLLSA